MTGAGWVVGCSWDRISFTGLDYRMVGPDRPTGLHEVGEHCAFSAGLSRWTARS